MIWALCPTSYTLFIFCKGNCIPTYGWTTSPIQKWKGIHDTWHSWQSVLAAHAGKSSQGPGLALSAGLLTLTFWAQQLEVGRSTNSECEVGGRGSSAQKDACGHSSLLGNNVCNGWTYKSITSSLLFGISLPTLNTSSGIKCFAN
jgi:hypothetical protein